MAVLKAQTQDIMHTLENFNEIIEGHWTLFYFMYIKPQNGKNQIDHPMTAK